MSPIAIVGVALLLGVAIAYRPMRRPGNLTPIQLISALGAWTLVLANASAMAIGIRDRSLVLLCTAAAAVVIALLSMLRQSAERVSDRDAPQPLRLVVDDLKQLLGGAPRLGVASLDAVVVGGRCPGIGVAVARQGRVIVRVRGDVAEWLESRRRPGGAGAELVASFARFIVLHELAHVLNGDHRTFRFVRSVLVAHVVWLAGAAAAAGSLILDRGASARPLVVAMSIIVVLIAQSLVARRFIAERERLADWRAMQTLSPADAARLLERRGPRRARSNPTELEKLMTDMKLHAPARGGRGLLSRLVILVWPAGDDVHERSEGAGGNRAGGPPRPVLWAALMGMQCGFLSMSLALAAMLAIASWPHPRPNMPMVTLAMMLWTSAPGALFCGLRVDPARLSVQRLERTGRRVAAGVVFYLAFAVSALVLNRFHAHFGAAPITGTLLVGGLLPVAALVGILSWTATLFEHLGAGRELQLQTTPRSLRVFVVPFVATVSLVLVPLSVIAAPLVGAGSFASGGWVPLALMSVAVCAVSSAMAKSKSPALRAIAPMAVLLDTPPPVYGFRVFWHNVYVDVSKTTLARAAAAATAVQLAAIPFSVLVAALLTPVTRHLLAGQPATTVAVFSMLGVMALILLIPDRYDGVPSAHLLFTDRLQVFERLLEASRTARPAAAGRLNASFAQWLRNDRFPDALLPQPEPVWPLVPLLILVRLARETGENAVLDRWRGRIEHALRRIVSNDAVAIAPGQPPSLYWTAATATLIDETDLRDAFSFDRMLDRIETLLDERLERGTANLIADVIAAGRLLRRHGRPGPNPRRVRRLVRSSSLVSRPVLRQSLAELADVAELSGDFELRVRLGPIVRSRMWECLQLNPRKDVLPLLDCYLAAVRIGELDERHAAAGVIVGELAERVSEELMGS
jgi:hypothetical protein